MIRVKVKTILYMKNHLGGFKEQVIQLPLDTTIDELLYYLISMYGEELRDELFEEPGKIRQGRALFVNGVSILARDGLNTRLNEGDEFLIFPPVGGG